jgi:ribosomal protein S18 acetylase RimI-like enzyme
VDFTERVRLAHADAWEMDGRARTQSGGGAVRVGGARLMSSGLPARQWNNGDVIGLPVDVEAATRWYAGRSVPWGLSVPVEMDYAPGAFIFTKRLMGLEPAAFAPSAPPNGVRLRGAEPHELDAYAALDAQVFESPIEPLRSWIAGSFDVPGCTHWLAEIHGRPIGILRAQRTDLDGGPCGTITGVGVVDGYRRRGIGVALTSHACAALFDAGVTLVHINPDTDAAASVYSRVGFREVPGLNVYAMSSGGPCQPR